MLLHVAGDALGSVAAITSAAIINFTSFEARFYADPICTLVICVIILYMDTLTSSFCSFSAVPLLKSVLNVIMQSVHFSLFLFICRLLLQ